jgi:hypothetical protein
MASRGILTLGALALLSTMGLARQAGQVPANLRAAVAGERAYLLGPAEQAAGPGVTWAQAAPKGRYILCERRKLPVVLPDPDITPPPAEVSLILWDTKTRKASTPWRFSETQEQRVGTYLGKWLSPTVALVAQTQTGVDAQGNRLVKSSLLIVNCGAGTIQTIPVLSPSTEPVGVYTNPVQPLIIITCYSQFGQVVGELILLRTSGQKVAQKAFSPFGMPEGWSTDGKRFYLSSSDKKANQQTWRAVDLNLNVTPLSEAPKDIYREEKTTPESLPIRAVEQGATLTVGSRSEKLPSLWLESAERVPAVRVAAELDPASGLLLPDLSAVAYRYQSALYVKPLISLEKTAYDDLLRRTEHLRLLSSSKQVGLALIMYAMDNKENFPAAGSNLSELILPYLQNGDLLKGFQFTYTGPSEIGKIEKPAEAVLGYFDGPGGRAVVYADGHARWEDG